MRCPLHRISLISKDGGLKCPKCGYLVKEKDLRTYNGYKRRNVAESLKECKKYEF